jgi:glyoxylate/hydroxypyruvate reductase A
MSLLYTADPSRSEDWRTAIAERDPALDVQFGAEGADLDRVRYLLAWQFPEALVPRLPGLQVIFSTGAGVEQFSLDRIPPSVEIVRMLDPAILEGMVEYAVFATLALHRDILAYQDDRKARRWAPIRVRPAAQRQVGVMGLGHLGARVLRALKPFGFPLYGWSRSPRSLDGVACFSGSQTLTAFLGCCDILICLLPLTPSTRGILGKAAFDALPPGAGLVNVGRGGHLREDELLDALGDGRIGGAVLDVLADEPPSPNHPFWDHPRILITPHIAGMTSPASAAAALVDNIHRHQAGEPMIGRIRRDLGY